MSSRAGISFPTPNGEIPDGWSLEWWEAFQALHTGLSYAQTATLVGRSPSTISAWVRRWRDQYGHQVFISSHEARLTPEARAEGQRAGGEATAVVYANRRLGMADRAGTAADRIFSFIGQALEALGSDRVRLAQCGTKEILDLARTAEILSKRADALSDIPSRKPEVLIGANVDLSALEAEVFESETQELLAAANDVIRRFKVDSGVSRVMKSAG